MGFFDGMGSGILSMAGGLINNIMAGDRAEDAMKFSAKMSSTAYQRGMADMRAAGLNPILAYQKGPASSPTGQMAATSDFISPAVASAQAARRLDSELENMSATNDNLRQQNSNLKSEKLRTDGQTANLAADTLLKTLAIPKLEAEGSAANIDKDYTQSTVGRILRMIGLGGKDLVAPVGALFGGIKAGQAAGKFISDPKGIYSND